jgi:ectoine hydroxylase-related dioxygenase (phytanoyl-CoA dioxygenase family)
MSTLTAPATAATSVLSTAQVATYDNTGYLHMPGFIDRERIARIAAAIEHLPTRHAALLSDANARFEFVGGDHTRIWRWDPIVDLCPEIAELANDPRLLAAVGDLYGGQPARLFKDKLIIKPANSRGNGLHQDYTWWQGFPTDLLTVTISIDAATRENGCTEIYPGMHRAGLLHPAGELSGLDDSVVAGHRSELFESHPGDAAVFHCFTPHRAGNNTSDQPRRQLFLSYQRSGDGDLYAAHYRHFLAYRMAEDQTKQYLR